MKKLIRFIGLFTEDFFILSGLGLIVYQTWLLNEVIAKYMLGFILLIIGLLLSREPKVVEMPPKKGGDADAWKKISQ